MPPWQFARKSYLSSFHPQKRGHKRFSSRHQKKLSKLDLVCYYLSVSPVVLIRIRDSSVGSQALRRCAEGEAYYQKRARAATLEKRLQGHVCRFLISRRQRLPGHLLSSTGESAGTKSCMSSLTLSISAIRLSISKERERAGSWMAPWRAQARYFSVSLSQVRGFFG